MPRGEWERHYNCGAATNSAFDLTVTQEGGTALSAVLRFDVPARSGQSGRFRLRGNAADAAGRFALSPSEWIDKPEGVAPFGLSGQISGNNQVLSGNLLGCGGASFEARRKQLLAPQAAEQGAEAAADVLSPPAAGGPLEGVWRGEMTCQIGDRRLAMPLEILVSHQGSALAAVLTSSLAGQRGIPASRWRTVYLSRAADGGGPLDQRIDLEGMSRFVRIEAILPDLAAGTLRLQIRNRTLFTLDWLGDAELRRQTSRELNKGETRNSLARAVFIHRLGEIRDRTYENQQHCASLRYAGAPRPPATRTQRTDISNLGSVREVLQKPLRRMAMVCG